MESYLTKLKDITTFIFDVDGVMTDGSVYLINGELAKKMLVKDGYALQLAVKKGYKVAVITGGKSKDVIKRLNNLGIKDVYIDVQNKLEVFEEYVNTYDINPANIMYMGDDIPDLEPMKKVGLPCCPANAVNEIKEITEHISPLKGGEGCVRDIIEKVLKVQNKWF